MLRSMCRTLSKEHLNLYHETNIPSTHYEYLVISYLSIYYNLEQLLVAIFKRRKIHHGKDDDSSS